MKFNELRDLIKYSREALQCLSDISDATHGPYDFSETIALLKHSIERAGTCEDPCEACQEFESEETDSEGTPLCRKCFLELAKDHLEEECKKANHQSLHGKTPCQEKNKLLYETQTHTLEGTRHVTRTGGVVR